MLVDGSMMYGLKHWQLKIRLNIYVRGKVKLGYFMYCFRSGHRPISFSIVYVYLFNICGTVLCRVRTDCKYSFIRLLMKTKVLSFGKIRRIICRKRWSLPLGILLICTVIMFWSRFIMLLKSRLYRNDYIH